MAQILIVDDRSVDRELLTTLLRYRGHSVVEAADGEQALARARSARPDLIIADILMPRMDGFRLVRELRADPGLAGIAVLFYTASYDSREASDLMASFGVVVLPKPSEPEAILAAVDRALAAPASRAPQLPPEEFDRRHLRLISDKLHQKTVSLEESNARLTELVCELRDEIESRRRAEAASEERGEWLRVVLASIGDAVIATDTVGRVVLLNPVAEAMTGWPQPEAAGRPLDEVFRIINEESRQTVESPVARVLREGTVQGLANHTLLIARDGSERAIDDCAAPIRDGDGAMQGVVLIFHDVTARRELERQLGDRAERLVEADRRKDEFLVMLAHELRNPLAPILNGLHVLRANPGDAEVVAEMGEVMGRQVEHLAHLVDDLLDVSRIIRGLVVLRPRRIDLVQLARQAAADHRARAEGAGLRLLAELPPAPVWVDADPTRLKQVADNLLGNALKFTDPGGSIALIVAAEAEGGATLTVRDTGIGVEPEILPRIFEPFAQADRSLERSRGGLGLGLALVRGLVELHGGAAEARSEGPGLGAEFIVRLRVAAGSPVPADAPPIESARTGEGRRVLVIEDSTDAARTLARVLRLNGYDVDIAHTGPAGIDAARRSSPELVICDIGLPGMDGFAVATALRADPATAGARLFALTGYGRDEDIRRARTAGFDDYLIKPADPDELLRKLDSARPRS